MARLIDADALFKAIARQEMWNVPDFVYESIMNIMNAPIVEAEPIRHGQWIEEKSIGDCCYKCSECGFIRDAYLLEVDNYCPQCGTKMDEVL